MIQSSVKLLHPWLRPKAYFLRQEALRLGYFLKVFETLRDEARQEELFRAGKSLCDGKIKKSLHQKGLAVDFQLILNGHLSWKDEDWAKLTPYAEKIGLEHGLTWKFKDIPHFQPNKENLARLLNEIKG